MHRFFFDDEIADHVLIRGPQAHQITKVLRLVPGQRITLVREGGEAEVELLTLDGDAVHGRVVSRRRSENELPFAVTLALPLLKGDHNEEVIEAVTQLGVRAIVPFISSRTVVRSLSTPKRERWQRIARESAETARRGRFPTIEPLRDWEHVFDALGPGALVAWEGETARSLHDAVRQTDLAIVIGPEGGLGSDEIAFARERGGVTVSLGPRNLRSETAAIAAVAQAVAVLV
jgi:16S rRNA (uracil1498-N3)-methyltransferase